MRLTFTATVESFDKDKYLVALQAEMKRVFLEAGKKFLLAAIPRIPIYTGFARGAFRNAEDLFGRVETDASSSSGFRVRSPGTKGSGSSQRGIPGARTGFYYYSPGSGRVPRTAEEGRAFGTPANEILDFTGASLASGRTSFYFRFKVDITYVDFNEEKWQAFKAGGDAFQAYLKENITLPDPIEYTTRKIVKGG